MKKQKVINIFKSSHKSFRNLIISLTYKQLVATKVLGNWTVKDIIAHLSAWNWEHIREIDNVLENKPTWNKRFKNKEGEDKFNKKAVEERRDKNIQTVIEEWENSFEALIKRIEKLREEEWNLKSMQRLFRYEESGLSDEGQHANQVKKLLEFRNGRLRSE